MFSEDAFLEAQRARENSTQGTLFSRDLIQPNAEPDSVALYAGVLIENLSNYSFISRADDPIILERIRFEARSEQFVVGAVFRNVVFKACYFKYLKFKHCYFFNVQFEACTFLQPQIDATVFENCKFTSSTFDMGQAGYETFKNCSFYGITCLTQFQNPSAATLSLGYISHFGKVAFFMLADLYSELYKAYAVGRNTAKMADYYYLYKKYLLLANYFTEAYQGHPTLKTTLTWRFAIRLFWQLLWRHPLWWCSYYVIGFGLKPYRPLLWYGILVLASMAGLMLTQISGLNSLKLIMGAVFTYGVAFLPEHLPLAELNALQLTIFYATSFGSLILNGLFVTSLFNYLTLDER